MFFRQLQEGAESLWHYIWAASGRDRGVDLDDGSGHGTDALRQSERTEDLRLIRRERHRLADMQPFAVGSLKDAGGSDRQAQPGFQGIPAVVNALGLKPASYQVQSLISDHGNEQVAFGAPGLLVKNRSQAEFRLEGSEHRLDFGQAGVGFPEPVSVLIQDIGPQIVDPGGGQHGIWRLGAFPSQGDRLALGAGFDGHRDGHRIVAPDFGILALEPANALAQSLGILSGSLPGEAFGHAPQSGFQPLALPGHDGEFFLGPGFRAAMHEGFAAIVRERAVDLDLLPWLAFGNRPRLFGIEVALPAPAPGQIAIALFAQPFQSLFRARASIQHDQGLAVDREILEHLLEGRGLALVAGEHLGTLDRSRAIQNQRQGQQRTVRAPFLGLAAPGLVLSLGLTFKIGVGQVIERDCRLPVEQGHETLEQMFLDGVAMAHQQIGGAIELHQGLPIEIHAQQFSGGAARAQPEVGPPLGTGLHQAHRDGGQGGLHQPGMARDLLQQILQAQLPQCPEAESLDARGANMNLVQAVLVHRVSSARSGLGSGQSFRCGANGIRLVIIVIRLRKCPSLLYGMPVPC